MTVTLHKPKYQRLIHSGMDWQQFKLIEQGFSDSPGIRLFYFKGEVEILAVSHCHSFRYRNRNSGRSARSHF